MDKEKTLVPKRRFREYINYGKFEYLKINDVSHSYSGGTPSVSNHEYYGGEIPFIRSGEISKVNTELYITEEGLNNSSAKLVNNGDILYALYGATSGEVAISNIAGAINQAVLAIIPNMDIDNYFLVQWLKKEKDTIIDKYLQGGQGNLSGSIVKNFFVAFPKDVQEQIKIGEFFKTMDHLINLQQQKITKLKDLKSAYLNNMFPKEGESVPQLRFAEFRNIWKKEKLESLIRYEQPTNYIVKTTNYSDSYSIPVLTAGKSFLLGYTDEIIGVYKANYNNPVIIFDDFTTSLHYVDFKFKVKSSAMKLLTSTANRNNLYFLYNLLKVIDYKPESHERHWISIYSKFDVYIPCIKEQIKIGKFFINLDNQIKLQETKLEKLKQTKQAYLNEMFL